MTGSCICVEVSPLDHSLLLDWQTRAKELKAGLHDLHAMSYSLRLLGSAGRKEERLRGRRALDPAWIGAPNYHPRPDPPLTRLSISGAL